MLRGDTLCYIDMVIEHSKVSPPKGEDGNPIKPDEAVMKLLVDTKSNIEDVLKMAADIKERFASVVSTVQQTVGTVNDRIIRRNEDRDKGSSTQEPQSPSVATLKGAKDAIAEHGVSVGKLVTQMLELLDKIPEDWDTVDLSTVCTLEGLTTWDDEERIEFQETFNYAMSYFEKDCSYEPPADPDKLKDDDSEKNVMVTIIANALYDARLSMERCVPILDYIEFAGDFDVIGKVGWTLNDTICGLQDFVKQSPLQKLKIVIRAGLELVCPDEGEVVDASFSLVDQLVDSMDNVISNQTLPNVLDQCVAVVRSSMTLNDTVFHRSSGEHGFEQTPEITAALAMADSVRALVRSSPDAAQGGPQLFLALLEVILEDRNKNAAKHKFMNAATKQVGGEVVPFVKGGSSASDVGSSNAVSSIRDNLVGTGKATLPISPQDHRKVTLVIEVAKGNLDVIPEIVEATGAMMTDENRIQLRRILAMMKSIKKLAGGRSLSSMSADDIVDVISMQIFNEFDLEQSGQISYEHFLLALERMRLSLSSQEAKMLFSKVDMDESGYITADEFKVLLADVQERYKKILVEELGLSKETIYIIVAWTGLWACCLFTFIILGVYGFSDGSEFTAVITGALPAAAGMMGTMTDPQALTNLLSRVDVLVAGFFARMKEIVN